MLIKYYILLNSYDPPKGDDGLDPDTIPQLISLVILLLLSAFFSSAETALTTVNIHKIRALCDQGNRRAARVLKLRKEPSKMLSAILIGNNIVNLSASALTTTLSMKLAARYNMGLSASTFIGIATGILTLLVLVFGEITPKTIANSNESMALAYSLIISWLTVILTPVIFLVNAVSGFFCRLLGTELDSSPTMTELELRTIVNVSHEDGVIEEEEKEMINNVVDFGDSIARDIMIPRIDVTFASVDMTYDQIAEIFIKEQYSRLPVYKKSKDHVIGIVNIKDVFIFHETHRNQDFDLRRIMRKPFFTYEFQKTAALMDEMRSNSISFAVVLDEYGVTAGLVTMEDLIEEIIGDIRDEFDEDEENMIRKVGDGEYVIEGSTRIDDINDRLGTEIESGEYDSIGGHMIGLLDHIPEEGETVMEGNLLFCAHKMDANRIETVYMKITEDYNYGKDNLSHDH